MTRISDNSLCINLGVRADRWTAFQERWAGHDVERFPACVSADVQEAWARAGNKTGVAPGWYASLHSHLEVVKRAREEGWEFVTVFEDDAAPGPCMEERWAWAEECLPKDVCVFNFGGVDWKMPTDHVKGPVFRVADRNHTWIEGYRVYARFYDVWVSALEAQVREGRWFADTVLEYLQSVWPVYSAMPGIVWQERQWSDNHGQKAWTNPEGLCPVPGWFRDEEGRAYLEEVVKRGVKQMVEVGVFKGRSTSWVAGHVCLRNGGALHAVDLFEKCKGGIKGDREAFGWHMWKMGVWERGLHILQEESVAASNRFDDGSLDLVFVDGDHHQAAVMKDLAAWVPKIRNGGVVCGHDYGEPQWPGVKSAVLESVGVPDRVVGTFWLKEVKRA